MDSGYVGPDTTSLNLLQFLAPQKPRHISNISIRSRDFNGMVLLMKLRKCARTCRKIHADMAKSDWSVNPATLLECK